MRKRLIYFGKPQHDIVDVCNEKNNWLVYISRSLSSFKAKNQFITSMLTRNWWRGKKCVNESFLFIFSLSTSWCMCFHLLSAMIITIILPVWGNDGKEKARKNVIEREILAFIPWILNRKNTFFYSMYCGYKKSMSTCTHTLL